jgi:hypothetical protein
MENIFLLDPEMGYPFASISLKSASITGRIISACAEHFKMPVHAIDASYYENFGTLQILFENGLAIYIDTDSEDNDAINEGPF